MYGIFTYIWVNFRANVVKYSMHGAYGFRLETTMILEIPQETPSQENGDCLGHETRILARPSWTIGQSSHAVAKTDHLNGL